MPSDIAACFDKIVPAPPRGEMTRKQIVRLIGDLKTSEQAKSDCGKRLIAWYDAQRKVFEK